MKIVYRCMNCQEIHYFKVDEKEAPANVKCDICNAVVPSAVQGATKALLQKFRAKYGDEAVVGLQYNGKTENIQDGRLQPFHGWQVFYKEGEIVKVDNDIYGYESEDGSIAWLGKEPAPTQTPSETFTQKLMNKINALIQNGTIIYAEPLAINEQAKKARVFVKNAAGEGVYIVSMDENGNLDISTKTNFTAQPPA